MEKKLKFFETENFKKAQKYWYDKLQAEKFPDHEKLVGTKLYLLPQSQSQYNDNVDRSNYDITLEYYLRLARHVEQEEFKSDRDRLIMKFHSEGKRICRIIEALQTLGFPCHRQTVRFVIRKFEHKWKIRHWQKKQMTSNLVIA